MSKYNLVASYYDMFEKNPNLKYKNEIEITLPEVDLSTLQAIDSFTASHTRIEIFKILEQQLGITGRNQLSIKYQKNKNTEAEYYKIIEDNPEFIPCTKNNQLINYYVGDKNIRTLAIPLYTPLLEKELSKLLKIINERNLEEFDQIYPYKNSNLYYLVKRYITSSYDTIETMQEDLRLIEKEFSRYKTFRGWIIAKEKKKTYKNKEVTPEQQEKVTTTTKEKINTRSIEEYSKEYEQEFDKQNKVKGITYESHQTYQYNTKHLDYDKEEFLEEKEMDFIEGDYYSQEDEIFTKRRRR